MRTDVRTPPLTPTGLARAFAAIAAIRVPGGFGSPNRGDGVLQGFCNAEVVAVSMSPAPKIRRGVSPPLLPPFAAKERLIGRVLVLNRAVPTLADNLGTCGRVVSSRRRGETLFR